MDWGIIYSLISLALVDAINPCEFAVMAMLLASILLKNPERKSIVLKAGLAFTSAIFIGYFIYGLVIVQLFSEVLPSSGVISNYIFKGFGTLAIILGLFNIKDYIWYRPGGLAREMPLSFRPRVKLLINKVTSPGGAFLIGLFVTIFLIPCTMGPYLIFSGNLSQSFEIGTFGKILLLLLYNFIFIIPMLLLTFIIYLGIQSVEQANQWKEKNIKKLHLIEGILLIILGIAMVTGLI